MKLNVVDDLIVVAIVVVVGFALERVAVYSCFAVIVVVSVVVIVVVLL